MRRTLTLSRLTLQRQDLLEGAEAVLVLVVEDVAEPENGNPDLMV